MFISDIPDDLDENLKSTLKIMRSTVFSSVAKFEMNSDKNSSRSEIK